MIKTYAEILAQIDAIDPAWFDRYPVSERVLTFIIEQGRAVISELEIFVGTAQDLPGITTAASVCARAHQTNTDWSVQFDLVPKLFPEVYGYFKSFFAYWKESERYL